MLYTVIPLKRIYRNTDTSLSDDIPACVEDIFHESNHLQVLKQGDKKLIKQLVSGNIKDYLKEEYQPGKIYKD